MKLDDQKIKETLLKEHYISEEDVRAAEHFAKTHHAPFVEYLFKEQLITKDLLGQAIAELYKVPYADLNSLIPTADQVKKIPEEIAKKYRAVFLHKKKIPLPSPQMPRIIKIFYRS